jgi:hypothetical protein
MEPPAMPGRFKGLETGYYLEMDVHEQRLFRKKPTGTEASAQGWYREEFSTAACPTELAKCLGSTADGTSPPSSRRRGVNFFMHYLHETDE